SSSSVGARRLMPIRRRASTAVRSQGSVMVDGPFCRFGGHDRQGGWNAECAAAFTGDSSICGTVRPVMEQGYTRIHADSRIDGLCDLVIGRAFAVQNTLGIGFLEKVYENALAHELRKAGLSV